MSQKCFNYCVKRNELINAKLGKYKCFNKGLNENEFKLMCTEKKDIKLIFKALDKLKCKWRLGDNLLDCDKLEKYYSDSMRENGCFCIIIDDEYCDSCIGFWGAYTIETGKFGVEPKDIVCTREIVRILINIYEELKGEN